MKLTSTLLALLLGSVTTASAAPLTTDAGAPVGDNQNSQTAGPTGGVLLQDFDLLQKLARFDRERIPERVVHARGAGAYGTFTSAGDFSDITKASLFGAKGKTTPMFVRFSTVIHSKDSPETLRDPRGFALKFYTDEGNWDLVGNNLPVFFIRDAMKFPDMVHSLKPDPVTNQQDPNRFFDFFSHVPESTHMLTQLYSDLGIPANYRHMDGSSVHAYKFVNAKGETRYVKFTWKTRQGVKTMTPQEAAALQGQAFSHATKDLYDAIGRKENPSWDLYAQVIPADKLDSFDFYPLDATKVWPEAAVPSTLLGSFTLDRLPVNFFNETEQSAFSPAVVPPGVEASEDRLLQGRLFSYADTQRYRLGANYLDLPINRAKVPVTNNSQDGSLNFAVHPDASPHTNYEPSIQKPLEQVPAHRYATTPISGTSQQAAIAKRNDFAQAGGFYRALGKTDQEHLVSNFAGDLGQVKDPTVKARIVGYLLEADKTYGERVAKAVNVKVEDAKKAAADFLATR
ncbi:MAG: catalase [Pseudomonadota bacterium]|nr:catalase [Pseudomonadota bacterium]